MSIFDNSPLRYQIPGFVVAMGIASLAMLGNAQSTTGTEAAEPGFFSAPETSPTLAPGLIPLSSSFQPLTPWPVLLDVSQTVLQTPHELLSYSGVEEQAKKLLGPDYDQWASHFGGKTGPRALPEGLLMATGCLAPTCTLHKSLLVVSPATHKVYAAMVSGGRVSMWPSLMSWPDDSIPTLKDWLADNIDNPQDKPDTKPAPKPEAKADTAAEAKPETVSESTPEAK